MKVLEYCANCSRLFEFDVETEDEVKPDSDCPVCHMPILPADEQCKSHDQELVI